MRHVRLPEFSRATLTRVQPAYCGLASLVVALNTLAVDPLRPWKGPWRHYDESMLDCCSPLEVVRARGITMTELACLARCNGLTATTVHATPTQPDSSRDALRAAVAECASQPPGKVLVVSFDRGTLGQTGDGHFSPVAAYHAPSDQVLVLDTARFKYPCFWVALPLLHDAMLPPDPSTGRARGWHVLARAPNAPIASLLRFPLHLSSPEWTTWLRAYREAPDPLQWLLAHRDEAAFPQLVREALTPALEEQVRELASWRALEGAGVSDDQRVVMALVHAAHTAEPGPHSLHAELAHARALWEEMKCCGTPDKCKGCD